MKEKILILDFGSQYTQLIARRIRELNVYSEIVPFNKLPEIDDSYKGIILSGSPFSVTDKAALRTDLDQLVGKVPLLGVCYGAQYIAQYYGGKVQRSEKREYGKALLSRRYKEDQILTGIADNSQVWMSHGDTIMEIPPNFELLAGTEDIEVAAFKAEEGSFDAPVYCLQFHPEVTHSLEGATLIRNFVIDIAGCTGNWTPASFIEETVEDLKAQIGEEHVILGLSGGVDSSVAAMLLQKAIGDHLICLFVGIRTEGRELETKRF